MADAGGGKRALKPVPATIANPGHVRERSAEFDAGRVLREAKEELERVKEELEAYKSKNGPETRAELEALKLQVQAIIDFTFVGDVAGIIPLLRAQELARAKLEKQIETLSALQAASDKLGAVVRVLGGTVTVDSDVAGLVYQLMMDEDAHKFALDANVIEIERLKTAVKPNDDGTKTGLEDRVKEYIRQIAELGRLRTAAEAHSETVKRENEILLKYVSELQQAIGDMSFVLNETIDQKMVKEEEMKIRRPDTSVDDPLTHAGNAIVLERIARFEGALVELPIIHTERTQYKEYGESLGNVVQDMSGLLSATISGDIINAIRPLDTKWNLDEHLTALNKEMTAAIGQFEDSIDKLTAQQADHEKQQTTLTQQLADQQAIDKTKSERRGRLTAYMTDLAQVIYDMSNLLRDIMNGDAVTPDKKIGRLDMSVSDAILDKHKNAILQKIDNFDTAIAQLRAQLKPASVVADAGPTTAATDLKLQTEYTAKCKEVDDLNLQIQNLKHEITTKRGSESTSLPTLREGTDRARGPSRWDEFDVEDGRGYTGDDHRPSGGVDDHEYLDDNELAKTLLLKLQALVGPQFEYNANIYDRIAVIITHAIKSDKRHELMHFMDPIVYSTDHSGIIDEAVFRICIYHYLKGDGDESNQKPRAASWLDYTPFGHHDDKPTEPNMSGTDRTPKTDTSLAANLSTPIANLLVDLKMMHDDM